MGNMVSQPQIPRQVTYMGYYHSLLQESPPILSVAWMPLGSISRMHLLTVLEETKSEEPDYFLKAYRGLLSFINYNLFIWCV